jgi:hypothetical protein
MLRGAHAALPWLAATRTPNVNLGSLYVTEECARILVGTNVDLIVVPDPEFMYSTTSWPFSAVVNTTSGFTPTNTRRPIVLNYPLSDADRLLLHPIFAHELGHASLDEHQLVAAVETQLDNDPAFAAALQSKVNDMAANHWTALAPTQISGILRARLRDWIEELLCDHLAIEAVGPSFMWSFVLFVLPLGYAEPGEEHPPNTVRIKLALDHLTRRGWLSPVIGCDGGVSGTGSIPGRASVIETSHTGTVRKKIFFSPVSSPLSLCCLTATGARMRIAVSPLRTTLLRSRKARNPAT